MIRFPATYGFIDLLEPGVIFGGEFLEEWSRCSLEVESVVMARTRRQWHSIGTPTKKQFMLNIAKRAWADTRFSPRSWQVCNRR